MLAAQDPDLVVVVNGAALKDGIEHVSLWYPGIIGLVVLIDVAVSLAVAVAAPDDVGFALADNAHGVPDSGGKAGYLFPGVQGYIVAVGQVRERS